MRTDAHDLACVRDATVELLLSHTATLPVARLRFGVLTASTSTGSHHPPPRAVGGVH